VKIYITGTGIVSGIGSSINETYNALLNEKTGLTQKEYPNLNRSFYTASVSLSNSQLAKSCNYKNEKISRSSLLGLKAAIECWGENQIHPNIKTGIISGTSVGGMDRSEIFYRNHLANEPANFNDLMFHDSGSVIEKVADHLNITDYINTISTACSSSSNAIMHGARLIKAGKLDRVLVGGVDALSEFTISGFKSLMIYNDELVTPFDKDRNGLNLGEGAGFLLLESEASIAKTGNKILAEVSGYHNSSDAHHQTATSPTAIGATLALNGAIKNANLKIEDIDYINAHGTGTGNNDLTESVAYTNVFKENIPPFSSTKAYTGHTLAASGAIEAIFCILSLNNNVIFPNLNHKNSIPETNLTPVTTVAKDVNLTHILTNALGFGGNCTALIISKVK
jgi:3-oxoacyl-(acyl-carrier-protein) synthase